MFNFFTEPTHMPCAECGASLAREERDTHVCDEQRRLDYELLQLSDDVAGFDLELKSFLATPAGRFALYYAARDRLGRAA